MSRGKNHQGQGHDPGDNEQKYLLLKVPDFALDVAGDSGLPTSPNRSRFGQPMTSYLRIGAASLERESGDDLIPYAFMAGPAGTQNGYDGDPAEFFDDEKNLETTAFLDDERNRGVGNVEPTGASGHGMTPAERTAWHTKHLISRGGWRDHSDGNRITTTYGDKVEVVRGNYKLVVMGRQDDPGNAIGHDMSGNHMQDFAQATMPGASVTVEWIQNGYVPGGAVGPEDDPYLGGAWLLINSTERVYQYSRNAGSFREQVWGDKNETYVGSENPKRIGESDDDGYDGHPEDGADHQIGEPTVTAAEFQRRLRPSSVGLPRGNPHIIEKTWAKKIESYTGSEKWRIPEIIEETWASKTTSRTDVIGPVSENTNVVGTVSTSTNVTGIVTELTNIVGPVNTSTNVLGVVTDSTTTLSTLSQTNSALLSDVTVCTGPVGSATTATNVDDATVAGAVNSLTLAGLTTDIAVVGVGVEVGVHAAKIGVDLAGVVIEATLALVKLTAEANILNVDLYAGIKLEFVASKGGTYTPEGEEVAITKKKVAGVYKLTCGTVTIN